MHLIGIKRTKDTAGEGEGRFLTSEIFRTEDRLELSKLRGKIDHTKSQIKPNLDAAKWCLRISKHRDNFTATRGAAGHASVSAATSDDRRPGRSGSASGGHAASHLKAVSQPRVSGAEGPGEARVP